MSELEEWFEPKHTFYAQPTLPERCAWVSVYKSMVVIGHGWGRTTALRGEEAREAVLALAGRTWQPLRPGRSRDGAPIFYKEQ